MSESETESADADNETEDESFEYYPQVTQHPTTVIEGEITDLVTGADIDGSVESTGTSFGVVYEDPEVGAGSLWRNSNVPEGYTSTAEFNDDLRIAINGTDIDYIRGREVTDDVVEQSRERVAEILDTEDFESLNYEDERVEGTDYKVADPEDRDANVGYNADGEQTGIDVGGGEFTADEVDQFDADKIMVWYGGMSGQFVGRGLDFNGMPFARWTDTDDGHYLVKGLFQVPIGWRGDADIEQFDSVETTDRSKLARSEDNGGLGRPPRVARYPILRDDLGGRTFVALGRYEGGNMHEVHIGRAEQSYDDLVEKLRNGDLDDDDYDQIEMKYDQDADDTIQSEFDNPAEVYALYEGEGWQDVPEDAEIEGGEDDGDFDTPDVDVDSDAVEHPTDQEVEFAENVAEKIAGTGVSPDDPIFPVGDDEKTNLDGLVEHNSDQFQVDPDADEIRQIVYENTAHLDASDA